jgi:cytoplasmic iron level regulating protein YaaA (DUF328/UPF0246 family)
MVRIALLGCTKLKQKYQCDAGEMYTASPLFRTIKRYISKFDYDQWFILSAKYGLLKPTDEISPYDESLYDKSKTEYNQWVKTVIKQLDEIITEDVVVDFYCGKKYRDGLIPHLTRKGIKYHIPLEGMGIGQQLKFLKEHV